MSTYNFTFATGETATIEIDEKWVSLLEDEDRLEYNCNHRETRRHESLYRNEEYGDLYAAADDVEGELIAREDADELGKNLARLRAAIQKLTPDQRDLVEKVVLGGMAPSEYAARKGVSRAAVSRMKAAAERNLKKFF